MLLLEPPLHHRVGGGAAPVTATQYAAHMSCANNCVTHSRAMQHRIPNNTQHICNINNTQTYIHNMHTTPKYLRSAAHLTSQPLPASSDCPRLPRAQGIQRRPRLQLALNAGQFGQQHRLGRGRHLWGRPRAQGRPSPPTQASQLSLPSTIQSFTDPLLLGGDQSNEESDPRAGVFTPLASSGGFPRNI